MLVTGKELLKEASFPVKSAEKEDTAWLLLISRRR